MKNVRIAHGPVSTITKTETMTHSEITSDQAAERMKKRKAKKVITITTL